MTEPNPQPAPLADVQVLAALAQAPEGVSLPWLAKRLGLRASQVLRVLAPLGAAGAGWLDVSVQDEQWRIRLTPAGADRLAQVTT